MSNSPKSREIVGWAGVSISTLLASFWAWWGINENFHEGWFSTNIWLNIGLMFAQYLSPMLIVMLTSGIALRWPRVALPVFGIPALAIAWFLLGRHAAMMVVVIPLLLVLLGALYHFGVPQPRRWAWNCLIGLPVVTVVASGAYPGWLAIHRLDDGNYGTRQIEGNGVTLVWAPEGPGWPSRGLSWKEASRRCEYLSSDGASLADAPQDVWRLPTVDEAVRSMVFRGRNAGGSWDPVLRRARYRLTPDKDSPLWKVYSQVIYWWTATETGENNAYYISTNGYVLSAPKRIAPDYLAFRCVHELSTRSALQVRPPMNDKNTIVKGRGSR